MSVVDDPNAFQNATTLNLKVRDAGLDGTGGASFQWACHKEQAHFEISQVLFIKNPSMFKNFPFSLTKLGAACGVSVALLAMTPALAQAQTPAASEVSADTAGIRKPEMTLQAAASAEVKQDTVHMTLSVEVEASDQASAGKKLASSVDDVVKRAQ
jgi:hypothetical protein